MRKRMMQLARGRFDYVGPNLSFSEEKIEVSIVEGRNYSGAFTIKSENEVPVRGIVVSNNPRMEILTPQFEGEEARIRFQFHSEGLVEGDVQRGELHVICNLREYTLPFCVSISKLYAESCIGKITNLYEFTKLAKEDWKEAYQLFYSTNFTSLIKDREVQEALVYRGISQAKPCNQMLEEFLIGIGKKEKIVLSVEQNNFDFLELDQKQKEAFSIRKDQWGYVEAKVYSDAAFLLPLRDSFSSDDFIGSIYNLEYYIDTEKMHAGKNYGRIIIETVYQKLSVEITAETGTDVEEILTSVRTQIKECKVGILELYQAYRLKRIVTGVWANETIDILNHLQALEINEPIYSLMKAQVYVINRQRQEADWILEEFKRECTNRKSVEWGYYLYIISLMEREPSYVDRITKEVEAIFRENPDSVFLFWILTFLQEQYYNNNGRKLKDIAYWIDKGCTSPYLYLEAYYLIWQEPFLLHKLDSFELKILRWAIRHNALTKDIATQIFDITSTYKEFSPTVFELMCAAYQANPKDEHVSDICSYLIKCQKYDNKYFEWYALGVEKELRITGLYEAFLLSMDTHEAYAIPKIIQMYFQYDSNLPYRKMAALYKTIISQKNRDKDVYQNYQRTMGKFAMEQAEKSHIDENLAVLYSDMLDVGLIDEEIAHGLAKVLFTHKLRVLNKRMVRAIVYQSRLKDPQIVPISNQEAYVQICSEEYVILLEDKEGRRYCGSMQYQLEKLMDPDSYLSKCMELAKDELNFVVYHFDAKDSYLTFEDEDMEFFSRILYAEDLSEDYQSQMVPEIIRFYKHKQEQAFIEQYLEQGDFSILNHISRKYIIELLVDARMYDKAYTLISEYGIDQIGSASKVTLASVMIDELDGHEDEFLTQLCVEAFRAGKYNASILQYLSNYLQSSVDELIVIWKACKNFQLDTLEIEERILTQMLYVNHLRAEADDVFRNYYYHDGRELVILAYLSLVCHSYFVNGELISPFVSAVVEKRFKNGAELNDACKLALFLQLSELDNPTEEQIRFEDILLAEYTRKNMYFAFYKKLDKRLIQKYHLYDKVFLEYRTNPMAHVVLHYNSQEQGDDFVTEEMPNVYDGIFVKQFAMFFGDVVQYYVSDEQNGRIQVTESTRITNNDLYGEKDNSRYNLINQMLISETLLDSESMYQSMKQYRGLEEVVNKIFTIL